MIYKAVFITLCCLTFSLSSYASHIIGADITYSYVGTDTGGRMQYFVRLTFYRNCCNGCLVVGPSDVLTVTDSCTNTTFTYTMSADSCPNGCEIVQLCPGQLSSCDNLSSSYPGMEKYVDTVTITLPSQCANWTVSWTDGARTAIISNLQNPSSQNIYIQATINNSIDPGTGLPYASSSPYFTQDPISMVCLDNTGLVTSSNGVVAPNGDSMVYALVNPLTAANTPIAFTPGYSAAQPMSSNPPVSLNTATGILTFSPTQTEVDVMAYLVKQYHNGVLIGSVMRDVDLMVINCLLPYRPLAGLPENLVNADTSAGTIRTCSGTAISFDIPARDTIGRNITLTSDITASVPALPGAGFTQVGTGDSVKAHITWTPAPGDTGCHSFEIYTTTTDCPVPGTSVVSYTVCVASHETVSPHTVIYSGTPVQLSASGSGGGSWSPTVGLTFPGSVFDPLAAPSATTRYTFTGSCGSDTVLVIDHYFAGPNQTICINNTATMAATGTGTWSVLPSNPAVVTINAPSSPTTTISGFTADGQYGFVWALAGFSDTVYVNVISVLPITFAQTNIDCYGNANGTATVTVAGGTAPYTYTWSPAEPDTNSLTGLSSGLYSLTVSGHNGCSVSASIYISQPAGALIATTDSVGNAVCGGSNGDIVVSVQGGTVPYVYTWSNLTVGNVGILDSLRAGSYCLTVTDGHQCSVTLCDTVGSYGCAADSVWPGDVNNDHLVDNNDLLPLGLAYDSVGPARTVQGNVWQGDSATDWTSNFMVFFTSINSVYADCNGDGIVNADDTLAILQNYGDSHFKTGGISGPWRTGIPALYAVASSDTIHSGDTLTVSFVLGNASLPVSNFYGLAFTYNFDPLVMDSNFTRMDFESSSWIGTPGQDISLSKIFNAGRIEAAVTRINHTVANGNGLIAEAKFKVTSLINGYINLGSISDITAIDAHGNTIPLNAGADTSVIVLPNGIRDISTETLHIQPNPAHDHVLISAGSTIRELSMTDVMGQTVMTKTAMNSMSMNIDITTFDSGVYFVTVRTDRGMAVAKLIVER